MKMINSLNGLLFGEKFRNRGEHEGKAANTMLTKNTNILLVILCDVK